MTRTSALMKFSPGGEILPSTVIGPQANIWLNGRDVMDPTFCTPGRRASCSMICLYVDNTACSWRYLPPVLESSIVNTFFGLNPGETLCRFAKLRINRLA